VIRDENGAAEAAGDATDDVDDADAQPTEQFLHVTHEQQLEDDTQQQLNYPVNTTTTHKAHYHIRALKHIRSLLTLEALKTFVMAICRH